jgi:hypothetical protein
VSLLTPLVGPAVEPWQERLGSNTLYAVGLVLSGLSASAGSSFWHDQSARLRSLKAASQAVSEVVGKSDS